MKDLFQKIVSVLTPDLIQPKYRRYAGTLYGYCYVVSETIYHLYGKKNGFIPFRLKHKGQNHWYLKNDKGDIIDLIADSFKENPFNYENSIRASFLTKEPSKRCKEIIKRIK
jgi:hypothetical protein